jgi:hypothetical protein
MILCPLRLRIVLRLRRFLGRCDLVSYKPKTYRTDASTSTMRSIDKIPTGASGNRIGSIESENIETQFLLTIHYQLVPHEH